MTKVIFVCHGNICRSPMAEMIFRDMVKKKGLEDRFDIFSRATSIEEIGNGLYPAARTELKRRGIPMLPHTAKQMSMTEYRTADAILVMDDENVYAANKLTGGDPLKKIERLRDLTAHPGEIDDPWYTGRFSEVFDQITEGCAALLERLQKDGR